MTRPGNASTCAADGFALSQVIGSPMSPEIARSAQGAGRETCPRERPFGNPTDRRDGCRQKWTRLRGSRSASEANGRNGDVPVQARLVQRRTPRLKDGLRELLSAPLLRFKVAISMPLLTFQYRQHYWVTRHGAYRIRNGITVLRSYPVEDSAPRATYYVNVNIFAKPFPHPLRSHTA